MAASLSVQEQLVTGEIALEVRPGTTAQVRDRALDAALSGPLTDAAEALGAVLAAPPHRFAHALPGKDEAGLTRFIVRGRAEGGRLVPEKTPASDAFAGDKRTTRAKKR